MPPESINILKIKKEKENKMYIKTRIEGKFTKVTERKAKTGKTHAYINFLDADANAHSFYITPAIATKVKDYTVLQDIILDSVVVYGTKDKQFDGVQIKNVDKK